MCRRFGEEHSSPVEQMGCKRDIRRAPAVRDRGTEADLQTRLDAGAQIWVVGDLHGHLATFRALVHRMRLQKEDRIVLLGDMIDRGPDSAGLIKYIREHPQIIAIKGNHEQMAIQSLQGQSIELNSTWMAKGGASTWGSYIVQANGDLHEAKLRFAEDCAWFADLPSHVVLDSWRLVHAGYHPNIDMDEQDEKTLLWIRRAFFKHDEAIDPRRCIIFGHTPTTKFGRSGHLADSKVSLDDGRPSWKAIDTCAYNQDNPCIAAFDLNSGKSIRQKTLRSERWWLRTNTRESPVAEHFGLAELRRRARKADAANEKARRRLAMAGVTRRVKGPVSFRVVRRSLPLVDRITPLSGTYVPDSYVNSV